MSWTLVQSWPWNSQHLKIFFVCHGASKSQQKKSHVEPANHPFVKEKHHFFVRFPPCWSVFLFKPRSLLGFSDVSKIPCRFRPWSWEGLSWERAETCVQVWRSHQRYGLRYRCQLVLWMDEGFSGFLTEIYERCNSEEKLSVLDLFY